MDQKLFQKLIIERSFGQQTYLIMLQTAFGLIIDKKEEESGVHM